MNLTRRTFFKVTAVGATALAGAAKAEAATATAAEDARGVLVDTTRCVGCRACEAACAEANALAGPAMQGDDGVFALRRATDQNTFTVVNRYPGGRDQERFIKTQCMHCVDAACAAACPVRALEKTAAGPVTYTGSRCLGCRYCMLACPFGIPKFQYDDPTPYVRKCTFCVERQEEGLPPACAEVCPGGALSFGRRDALIEEAKIRIYQNPDKYVHHVYGEHEAGGTSWLYISDVPLDQLGLPGGVEDTPYPQLASTALAAVPMILTLWPPILMGLRAITCRRDSQPETAESRNEGGRHD
ncbi:MAG TPA: 4Fe-4S dicluster domain-containing protein [Vicinamibacterales bacterium]|nr:4Fe-4S dicluster domain-containing protein [Vicinamibacterales bacterium]